VNQVLPENTVIGCAFNKPNHFVLGTIGNGKDSPPPAMVYDIYYTPLPERECQMAKLEDSDNKSIICYAVDQGVHTAGVCVFTRDESNDLTKMTDDVRKKALGYLRERTEVFHKDFIPVIENNRACSLAEREPKTPPSHK
jgi:hypothetical protein